MSSAATALTSDIEPQSIDWEEVFEAEGHGLIALINEAKSFTALKGCMGVIVEQLFSRDGDQAFRDTYMSELDSVFPENLDGRSDAAETLTKLIAVMTLTLRKIKAYRIKKAKEYRAGKLAGGAEPQSSDERRSEAGADETMLLDATADAEDGEDGSGERPENDRTATEKIFAEVIAAEYQSRFRALQLGIKQNSGSTTKLPFILSAEFAEIFDTVLRKYLIPEFVQRCHETVTRGMSRSADKQKSYFQEFTGFEGGQSEIWEYWRYTWTEATTREKLPARPTGKSAGKKGAKKKKGLFGLSLKKSAAADADAAKTELERWKTRVARMEKSNGLVDAIWDALCAEADGYQAPLRDTDGKLLMDIFGRSSKSLTNQVQGINQIVAQGEEMARAFQVLEQGKDIEICLLAACFQDPEQFLGRKQVLKQLLGGYKGGHFPLILRYLPQHIRA